MILGAVHTITWSEFVKWQRFAHLVQERNLLASAMNDAQLTGECAEALKALTGYYPSSFFDGTEIPKAPEAAEFDARILREHREIAPGIKEGSRRQERRRRDLWEWFRQPPCSIEWMPKSREAGQRAAQKFQYGEQ